MSVLAFEEVPKEMPDMLPSIDLSHFCRPRPIARWRVVNEWTALKAEATRGAANASAA